jgi:Na+/proline symporter
MASFSMLLPISLIAIAALSFAIAPKAKSDAAFFQGLKPNGEAPNAWALTLSQVTTWIFARSLMTCAILGFYYGIAGVLAYAAYYLSFVTGGIIIDRIRFKRGYNNIQSFLFDKFGKTGERYFNIVIALRLLSEVFANLIVVGLIFGAAGTSNYTFAVVVTVLVTFAYSAFGGLGASIRTDILQASVVIIAIAIMSAALLTQDAFSVSAIITSTPELTSPGWVLLLVAFLQVWSYPMHDPVMMDRGFIASREETRKSFINAAWISITLIIAFGLLGVFAGLEKQGSESMLDVLNRLFSPSAMAFFNLALIISAVSTLDSTFSSASKLVAKDMHLVKPTVNNGRLVMLAFLLGGCGFLFLGSKDLFAAVAVSGTASMFLIPVIFFTVLSDGRYKPRAISISFFSAIFGAFVYMAETSKYITWVQDLTGLEHKYSWLLFICVAILVISFAGFITAREMGAKLDAKETQKT